MKTLHRILVLSAVVATTACGGVSPQYQYTATGAAVGAAAGALVGNQINDNNGALVGGAAGALVGGVLGRGYDQQRYYGYQGGYAPQASSNPQASSSPYPDPYGNSNPPRY